MDSLEFDITVIEHGEHRKKTFRIEVKENKLAALIAEIISMIQGNTSRQAVTSGATLGEPQEQP